MALVTALSVKNRALSPRTSSQLWRLSGTLAASFLRPPWVRRAAIGSVAERIRPMQSWHRLRGCSVSCGARVHSIPSPGWPESGRRAQPVRPQFPARESISPDGARSSAPSSSSSPAWRTGVHQPAGTLGRLLGDGRSPVFGNPDGVDIHDAGVLDDHLAGAHAHCRRVRRR